MMPSSGFECPSAVFSWFLIKDRLHTRNILRRNMVLDSFDCIISQQTVQETAEHLFLRCPFATSCRSFMNLHIQSEGSFPEVAEFEGSTTPKLLHEHNNPHVLDFSDC